MKRMGNPAETPLERFAYGQYKTWPDEERWELIEGQAWNMSPAPSTGHQRLSRRLFTRIAAFLEGKTCEAFDAPFDVLLPEGDEPEDAIRSVVQPDIVVYCDRSKLQTNGARGAPDLAVEILSPRTSKKDQREKMDLYERHGVREYWVLDPVGKWLCVYHLETRIEGRGRLDEGELREELGDYSPVASRVLEGFSVDPKELFAEQV